MVTALHKDHGVPEGIHQIHNWEFANAAARLAYAYQTKDIGKVARQLDDGSFWVVESIGPVTFTQVGGSGGSGDVEGPTGATDSAIALFDGTTGKVLKSSIITVDGYSIGNVQDPIDPQDVATKNYVDTKPVSAAGGEGEIQYNASGALAGDPNLTWSTGGTLKIGNPNVFPNSPLAAERNEDDYLQVSIQNTSNGTDASSDFVATADNGNDSSFYVDLGINSSTYNNPDYSIGGPNDAYLLAEGGDLAIGSSSGVVKFHTGGSEYFNLKASITDDGILMNSNLDMDGYDILNVGLINSVSIDSHVSRHYPSGDDPLPTAAPESIAIGNIGHDGYAESFSRSDHVHEVLGGSPVDVNKSTASDGVLTSFARSDHKHDISTATAVSNLPGTVSSEGVSSSLARADHTHELPPFGDQDGYFCEGNDPRLSDTRDPTPIARRLTVALSGGQYTSIKAAVDDAILGGASQITPWQIEVYPGTYIEDPITIIEGIVLKSADNRMDTVTVVAYDGYEDLFTCYGGDIGGIAAAGVIDPSKALFRCNTALTLVVLHGVTVFACSNGVVVSDGASCILTNFSVIINAPDIAVGTAVSVTGVGSYLAISGLFVSVPSILLPYYSSNPVQNVCYVSDSATLSISNGVVDAAYITNDFDVFHVDNGATANLISCEIRNVGVGLHIGSAGTGTTAIVQGGVWQNNYLNLLNESSTSSVYVSAASNVFGVSAVPGSTFTGVVQITDDNSTYIVGDVSYFYPSEKSAALGTLFHDIQSTGLSIGGDVTEGIGLSVDVAAGRGWISRHVPVHDIHNVSWEDGYVNLSPNQTNYVVWDSGTESLNNQLSAPGHEQILLATVITSGSGIRFLHKTRTIAHDLPHILSDYLANTRNIALVSGITASIGSSQTQFSISSGSYYRVLDQIVFDGYVDANFSYFYGTDGASEVSGQNEVDIANYDNNGVLTAMSDGYYRSDTVYLTSDGRISVIYGIAEYLTATEAENSVKLSSPSFLTPTACSIAKLIVEDGYGIVSVVDARPIASAANISSSGGSSSHSSLSDLDKPNDHPWAMLVDGSRNMSGDLNLGGNDIENVGNVDGVNVSGHAARHNPGGLDALSTGTPVAVTVGAVAAEGAASSFARSDHQHGISSGTPSSIGTANSAGSASTIARSDHIHNHGSQTEATHHAVATTGANGFMSSTDKSKLDGIASGATNTPLTASAPANVTKATAAVGVAIDAARADHKHDISTASASGNPPGSTSTEGSSTSLARADHTHALASFGTSSGTFCEGNDSRLSNARTPTAHATTHQDGGGDEISVAGLSGQLADAQKVTVRKNSGVDIGTRARINFIEGTNVTLTVADDAGNGEVDVTIAASGGSGSGDVVGPSGATDNAIAIFDGATGKIIQNSDIVVDGYSLDLPLYTSVPSIPATGHSKLFVIKQAERPTLSLVGPSGRDVSFQALLGQNKVGWWTARGNGTVVSVVNFGNTATGTATTRNVAVTNVKTAAKRLGYVSTAAINSGAGTRHAIAQFWRGNAAGLGGFTYIARFGFNTIFSTSRCFVGLSATTGALSVTVDPSTLFNLVSIGFDAGDTNFQFMHNDGSGTATKVNLGANFPKTSTTDLYEVIIRCSSNSSDMSYQLSRLNTAFVAVGTVSTDLPSSTTLLSPQILASTGAGTSAVGIDVVSQYIETDY